MLREGRNCWRIGNAGRLAFLIDGESYFGAFRAALMRARRRAFVIGWDVDSRVDLCPQGASDGLPSALLPFLNAVLEAKPELEVYVLGWDFSVIYALEREPLPSFRFGLRAHERLRFALDGVHPVGASHHQKIVVVDDALAFVGGLDLTIRRWDTPEHRAENPRRVDHNGSMYPPVHDAEIMVDGPVAAALAEVARQRWLLATGEELQESIDGPVDDDAHPWPDGFPPAARNLPLGIARTAPTWAGHPGISEVENLILDVIASARRDLYIENQYLTSTSVAHSLGTRLREPDGPRIVVVLPREESGWIEQSSMGLLRRGVLRQLRDADRFGRLRIVHPVVPGLAGNAVNLHSKLMVADDRLAWIGSANLSNRSMGLDTECVLALDAELDSRAAAVIARLRDELLAEHLGSSPATVRSRLAAGGLTLAVDELGGGPRRLAALDGSIDQAPALNFAILDGVVCDPERPAPDKLLAMMVPAEMRPPIHRSVLRWAAVFAVVLGIVALWRFTPLGELRNLQRLAELGEAARNSPLAPLLVLGGYVAGALVLFPITALLTATAFVFPSIWGVLYGLSGGMIAALLTYGVGRLIGQRRARWLARPRLLRFQRGLQGRGMLAVMAARLLPVGNFSLFNMVAGALHIRLRDYIVGNVLGLLPGIVVLVLLAHHFGDAVRRPRTASFALLGIVILAAVVVFGLLRRRLRRTVRTGDETRRGVGASPRTGSEPSAP